jgi:hypothetical protein
MGRRVGYVLVFVGFFLIFSALLLRFYAYPRLQKAPLDQYSQPVATGTGTYFNRAQLNEVTSELKNIRTVKGDAKAGNASTAVWDSFSVTQDVRDGGVLIAARERIALDRVSAESKHCCGDQPPHSGLTLKFPFNTHKRTYSFWDTIAERAFPAAYTGTERIEGVTVYRFEQRFSGVRLQTVNISGAQAGQPDVATVPATVVYGNVKTLWVEPRTGIIVKAGQNVSEVLQAPNGKPVLTVVKAQLVYDHNTVRTNAEDARSGAGQLRMIQWILPVAALILGVVLIVIGVVLIGRQRPIPSPREAAEEEPHPADAR